MNDNQGCGKPACLLSSPLEARWSAVHRAWMSRVPCRECSQEETQRVWMKKNWIGLVGSVPSV